MPRATRRARATDPRDPREFITVYVGMEIRPLIENVCQTEGRKISPYILHLIKSDLRTRGMLAATPTLNALASLPADTLIFNGTHVGRFPGPGNGQLRPAIIVSRTAPAVGNRLLITMASQWPETGRAIRAGEVIFNQLGHPIGSVVGLRANRTQLSVACSGTLNNIDTGSDSADALEAAVNAAPFTSPEPIQSGVAVALSPENMFIPQRRPRPRRVTAENPAINTAAVNEQAYCQLGPSHQLSIPLTDSLGFTINPRCRSYEIDRRGALSLITPGQDDRTEATRVQIERRTSIAGFQTGSQCGACFAIEGDHINPQTPHDNLALFNGNGEFVGVVVNAREGAIIVEHTRPNLMVGAVPTQSQIHFLSLQLMTLSAAAHQLPDSGPALPIAAITQMESQGDEDEMSRLIITIDHDINITRGSMFYEWDHEDRTATIIGEYTGPTTITRTFAIERQGHAALSTLPLQTPPPDIAVAREMVGIVDERTGRVTRRPAAIRPED